MLKKHISDLIFIKWFLFFISLIIALLIMHQLGFLTLMLFNDISHISSLIILLIFFFSTFIPSLTSSIKRILSKVILEELFDIVLGSNYKQNRHHLGRNSKNP